MLPKEQKNYSHSLASLASSIYTWHKCCTLPDESSPNATGVTYQYTPLCLHSHDMKLECGCSDTSDRMEWENLTLHLTKSEAAEDIRSRGGRLQKAAAQRRVVAISLRETRKNFSPSFFSYQDGLSLHLRVLYWCTRINAVK